MTRHWIEAFVAHDTVSFRCVCEDVAGCTETASGLSCAVVDWFKNVGVELLDWPSDRKDIVGRFEVAAQWTGYDEDAVLSLVPPSGGDGVS